MLIHWRRAHGQMSSMSKFINSRPRQFPGDLAQQWTSRTWGCVSLCAAVSIGARRFVGPPGARTHWGTPVFAFCFGGSLSFYRFFKEQHSISDLEKQLAGELICSTLSRGSVDCSRESPWIHSRVSDLAWSVTQRCADSYLCGRQVHTDVPNNFNHFSLFLLLDSMAIILFKSNKYVS